MKILKIPHPQIQAFNICEIPDDGDNVEYVVSAGVCTCGIEDCFHSRIANNTFEGPLIPPEEVGELVDKIRGSLASCELLMPVGRTLMRRPPIHRLEILGQCTIDGVELWASYHDYVVRLITTTKENFDKIMDSLKFKIDGGEIEL